MELLSIKLFNSLGSQISGFTPEIAGDPLGLAGIELDAYPTLSSYFVGFNVIF